MKQQLIGVIALLGSVGLLACNSRSDSAKDIKPPERPVLYLHGLSQGHKVTVEACGQIIWDNVLSTTGFEPQVRAVSIPRGTKDECLITVRGGPFDGLLRVKWSNGEFVIAHFDSRSVQLSQEQEHPRIL